MRTLLYFFVISAIFVGCDSTKYTHFDTELSGSLDSNFEPDSIVTILIKDSVVFNNSTLSLIKGSKIIFGKNAKLLIQDGSLDLNGVLLDALREGEFWDRIYCYNSTVLIKKSEFNNGLISCYNSKSKISKSSFKTTINRIDRFEMPFIYIKNGSINVKDCSLINKVDDWTGEGIIVEDAKAKVKNNFIVNIPDAVEFTRVESGLIKSNRILNSRDDGIDLNACRNINVLENTIVGSKDKAISIGSDTAFDDSLHPIKWGKSIGVLIKENHIINCSKTIIVKDGSVVNKIRNVIYDKFIDKIEYKSFHIKSSNNVNYHVYTNDTILFSKNKKLFYFDKFNEKLPFIQSPHKSSFHVKNKSDQPIYIAYKTSKKNDFLTVIKGENEDVKRINLTNQNLPTINIFIPDGIENEKIKGQIVNNKTTQVISIKIRGNTSSAFPKKQFSVSLDSSKPNDFFNLQGIDWVLNAPYADRSLIRNVLTYRLGNSISLNAPKTSYYNLLINNQYEGLYVLMPKINANDSISFIKMDDEFEWTTINQGAKKEMKKIRYKFISTKSNNVLINEAKIIVNTLEYGNYTSIKEVINTESFAKYFIVNELSKNIDAYRKSIYMSLNHNSKMLSAGPLWDYNLSYGLPNYNNGHSPKGFMYNNPELEPYMAFWWKKLITHPEFKKELKAIYTSLRLGFLSNSNINKQINSIQNEIRSDQKLNYKKWNVLKLEKFYSNSKTPGTWEGEIKEIKDWLEKRLDWLDEQWLFKL